MAHRFTWLLLAVALPVSAKVYVEVRPRATLLAGYDDNVQLDGRGADSFGQATPGLKLDLFGEHQLHLGVDCQAGIARLLHPEQFGLGGAFAANETCTLGMRDELTERTRLKINGRATYAQDPMAIAGLGLLLRPGQEQVFVGRLSAEVDRALSPRSTLEMSVASEALSFGAGDPGNGILLTPVARWAYRSSPRTTWDFGVREQLFFAEGAPPNPKALGGQPAGLLNEGHAALAGWTYRLNPWSDATLRAGPLLVTGRRGDTVMPVARFELEATTPSLGAHVTVGHDLVIGASTAGPLVGDIAEVALLGVAGPCEGHLRASAYRNASAYVNELGSLGYGLEAALDVHVTREWRIGVAALRDARIYDPAVAVQVDRDVLQLRLTWERL